MIADKTNLLKLADTIEAYGFECEGGPLKNCKPWMELKRRLASSDSGVKGEPEPVAWIIHFKNFNEVTCDPDKAARWRAIYPDQRVTECFTAPPADAAMRWRHKKRGSTYTEIGRGTMQCSANALIDMQPVVIYRSEHDGSLWVRGVVEFEDGRFEALTAPGATTKSDGGAKAGSSPILASKEEQRTRAHGVMPVGDNADASGGTGVGPSEPKNYFFETEEEAAEAADNGRNTGGKSYYRPSDPSSTRSDVTALASLQGEDAVERVARIIIEPRLAVPDNCQFTLEELRSVRWSQSTKAEQQDALNAARAILATGLVPDEAEIRADEREKCAAWHDDQSRIEMDSLHCGDNTSTIAAARRRADWHDKAAAAIRSGDGE